MTRTETNVQIESDAKQRNLSMDILRIFACFLVILYHSRGLNRDPMTSDPISIFNTACGFGAFFFGSLGVPLFLMIGGYFAFQPELNTFIFLKKRLGRVVIPTLFWLLLSTLLIGGTDDFFYNVWNLKCAGHLWYMYTLIGILFLIPVVNPFLQKATKKELALYVGIWALTLVLNGNYFDVFKNYELTNYGMSGSNPVFAFIRFYGYFGYYLLGFIASKFLLSKKTICSMFLVSISSWLFTVYVLGLELHAAWFYLSIPVVLFSFALFESVEVLKISNLLPRPVYAEFRQCIETVSYLTFGAYLVHWLVLHYLSKIELFLHINMFISGIIAIIISFSVSYIISLVPLRKYIIG